MSDVFRLSTTTELEFPLLQLLHSYSDARNLKESYRLELWIPVPRDL